METPRWMDASSNHVSRNWKPVSSTIAEDGAKPCRKSHHFAQK
jgi:hypothetical protein